MKYELIHDTIARQVFEKASTEARTRRKVERFIRERYEANQLRGAKLTQDDLDYINPYLAAVNISETENRFIQEGRRALRAARMRKRIITGVVIGALLIAFLVSLSLYRNAETQKELALTQTIAAVRSDNQARKEAGIAKVEGSKAMVERLKAEIKSIEALISEDDANFQADKARTAEEKAREQARLAKLAELQARKSDTLAQINAREASAARLKADIARDAALNSEQVAKSAFEKAQEGQVAVMAVQAKDAWRRDNSLGLNLAYAAYRTIPTEASISVLSEMLDDKTAAYYTGLRHGSAIEAIAVHPRGNMIVTGGMDSTIKLWGRNGELRWTSEVQMSSLESLAFSQDEDYVLSGNNGGEVSLWKVIHKEYGLQHLHTFESPEGYGMVQEVSFSPDGQYILAIYGNAKARLWKATSPDWTLIQEIDAAADTESTPGKYYLSSATFASDNASLLTNSLKMGAGMSLWNVNGKQIGKYSFAKEIARSMTMTGEMFSYPFQLMDSDISSDGQYILGGSATHGIQIWKRGGKRVEYFPERSGSFLHKVAFFPGNENYFISVQNQENESEAVLWKTSKGRGKGGTRMFFRANGKTEAAVFSLKKGGKRMSRLLVMGGSDGIARVWSIDNIIPANLDGKESKEIFAAMPFDQQKGKDVFKEYPIYHPQGPQHVAYSSDFSYLLLDKSRMRTTQKNAEFSHDRSVLMKFPNDYLSYVFAPQGTELLIHYPDQVMLWEVEENQEISRWKTETATGVAIFIAGGKEILTGHANGSIHRRDRSGNILQSYRQHKSAVAALVRIPETNRFLSGSATGEIIEWNLTGDTLNTLKTGIPIKQLCVSGDGRRLLSGFEISAKGTAVTLWKQVEGQWQKKESLETSRSLTSLAFSPDSNGTTFIANGSLWHTEPFALLTSFPGAISFSPDGTYLLNTQPEKETILWRNPVHSWNPRILKFTEDEKGKYGITVDY